MKATIRCRTLLVLGVLLHAPLVAAEEGTSVRDQLERTTKAVSAAFAAGDAPSLEALAKQDAPDPWLVVEWLCHRTQHDAALAFARAAPRKLIDKLPAYVESQRSRPPDEARWAAAVEAARARAAQDWPALLAAAASDGPLDSVLRVSQGMHHAIALLELGRRAEGAAKSAEVAVAARELGWYSMALSCAAASCKHFEIVPDLTRACEMAEVAVEIARALGNERRTLQRLKWLAQIRLRAGDSQAAISAYAEALKGFEAYGNTLEAIDALICIGLGHFDLGEFEVAKARLDDALRRATEAGDAERIAACRINLANLLTRQGRHEDAREAYRLVATWAEDVGDTASQATALKNIGILESRLGQPERALATYTKAQSLLEPGRSTLESASLDAHIGQVLFALGNRREAFVHAERAVDRLRDAGAKSGLLFALLTLAGMRSSVGHHETALRAYEDAVARARELGDPHLLAHAVGGLAGSLLGLRRTPEAVPHLEEALALFERLGAGHNRALALRRLGIAVGELGEHARAVDLLRAAIDLFGEVGDERGQAIALRQLATESVRHGEFEAADDLLTRALDILGDLPAPESRAHILAEQALVDCYLGRYEAAAVAARNAIDLVNDLATGLATTEGATSRGETSVAFDAGIHAALHLGDLDQVTWFFEQSRAGTLRESLGSREELERAVLAGGDLDALSEARRRERVSLDAYHAARAAGVRKEIREAKRAWEVARRARAQLTERLQRDAKAAARVVLPPTDGLALIQSRLAEHEAMVLYGLAPQAAGALLILRDAARVVTLAPPPEIDEATGRLSLSDPASDDALAVADLTRLLTAPLDLPAGVTRVLVSPDGALAFIPFSLLLPEHQVAYLPSGTAHGLLGALAGQRGTGVLALGDPDYGTLAEEAVRRHRGGALRRLPPLPATRGEVERVGTTLLLGSDATEANLRARLALDKTWRAVHFACHGLLDAAEPAHSCLALTADDEDDGFLTCLEVLTSRVPADLAVLSACETGKGRVLHAEGVSGLASAFMHAGVPRVLCSLWKVDDLATQALMIRFYELWNPRDGAKGLGAAAALKAAQAYVREHPEHDWKHPYYWAAWVLWGLAD